MATGVTEIIRLFAGHFHLSDEVARMRQSYDEFMAQREREDFDPGADRNAEPASPVLPRDSRTCASLPYASASEGLS